MSEELFSARLTEALKASGLSQAEVAKKAGITAPYLSDLKKGKRGNPSPGIVLKLAEALATTPAWLMSYSEKSGMTDALSPAAIPAENVESSAKVKESESASSTILRDEPVNYRTSEKSDSIQRGGNDSFYANHLANQLPKMGVTELMDLADALHQAKPPGWEPLASQAITLARQKYSNLQTNP